MMFKYKTLAGRHRQYLMQKTNEKKRLEQLKADNKKIISELIKYMNCNNVNGGIKIL